MDHADSGRLKLVMENFLQCKSCRLVYFTKANKVYYEDNYFNSEYEKQYGKSYVDDEATINKRLIQRYNIFKKYIRPNSVKQQEGEKIHLLEFGSAAGFFLGLMKEKGYSVTGWEISQCMSDFANSRNLPTKCGDIIELYDDWKAAKGGKFNVVAAFYVLEHIANQAKIWNIFKDVTKQGGLLLLALPSIQGPGFIFNRKMWVNTHPEDHFVDYSPSSLKRVAQLYGFKALFFSSEGIHPERFPLGKTTGKIIGLNFLYKYIQKQIAFSDTIFAGFIKDDIT